MPELSKMHLSECTTAPARAPWVVFDCLVSLLFSFCLLYLLLLNFTKCPIKAEFAKLEGCRQWHMTVPQLGKALPWDLF